MCVRKTSQLKPRKSVYMWKRLRLSSLGGNSKWMDRWKFNNSPLKIGRAPKGKQSSSNHLLGRTVKLCSTSGGVWVIDFQLVGPIWEQTSSKAVFWQSGSTWCWHRTWKTAWWFRICFDVHSHLEKWSNLTHIFQMGGSTTKGFLGFLRGRWESVWRWLTPWTLEVTTWGPTFPGGRWGVNWMESLEDNWNTVPETNSKSTWKLMVNGWKMSFNFWGQLPGRCFSC